MPYDPIAKAAEWIAYLDHEGGYLADAICVAWVMFYLREAEDMAERDTPRQMADTACERAELAVR